MNYRLIAAIPAAAAVYNLRKLMSWEVTPTPGEFALYVLPMVVAAVVAYFSPEVLAFFGRVGDPPQPKPTDNPASPPFPDSIARTLTLAEQHLRDGLASEAYAAGQIACDLVEKQYPPVKAGEP